jgi:hypothetical protein
VRTLIEKHLPKDRRERSTWRHVAAELEKSAAGGGDTEDVSMAAEVNGYSAAPLTFLLLRARGCRRFCLRSSDLLRSRKKRYLRANIPSRGGSRPPQARHVISRSLDGSALARLTWYRAAHFGHLKSRTR